MSESPGAIPPVLNPAHSTAKTLRLLFLTLFLRGRGARGLQKNTVPKSVGSKLALTLGMYALFGALVSVFFRQPVFPLSIYLHSMTLVFLGMFVASSAGEVLFNKEEADILMHRPVSSRELLWAKIRVLVEVSLWLAGAFNLVGLFIGVNAPDGGWLFPVAHVISTAVQALFCTGTVVMIYQLCLRWFGRERLEGIMTTAQVLVAVGAALIGQIVPRMIVPRNGLAHFNMDSWWIGLLPPAWFAGFDDAIAGRGNSTSWVLAGFGFTITAIILWLAFGKLARNYELGVQALNETVPTRPRKTSRRRWIDVLASAPPLRWCLRNPISRASFLLTAAYLIRDRDVKLRIYPGIAPMLVIPVVLLVQGPGAGGVGGEFPVAFVAAYLPIIPMLALSMLQYSQQWQASDLFRVAPMRGPAPICHGARLAVTCFITVPLIALAFLLLWWRANDRSTMLLFLPGLLLVPVCSLIPFRGGSVVPLSTPSEEAKSVSRGLTMMVATFGSLGLGGLAFMALKGGWLEWLLGTEFLAVICLYVALRRILDAAEWTPIE